MTRWTWLAVALAIAVASGVATLALRAARRDRAALVAGFSEEHLSRLRFATREVESGLQDVWHDLEFATRLVDASSSAGDRRRELKALLAVVRAYRMVVVYDADGREQLSVVDPLAAPEWSPAPFRDALEATARGAIARHGRAVSPLVPGPHSRWNRVFVAPSGRPGGGAVALLVDLQEAFERLRVVAPDPASTVVVLAPGGAPTPMTPPRFADLREGAGASGPVASLASAFRTGEAGTSLLGPHDAQALGLPATETIAAFAPVREGAHGRWSVAVLDPTSILRSQERAITLQVAAVGAILALALSILSAYLVLTARRVIAYQERLRAAEQLVRAEKLATVGVLAAGIAHEIGTPLAVVRGRAQRIAEKLGPEHAQTDGAATIVREIDRVSRTVRELLDYARPSAARTVAVSPASVARWVVELLEVEARSRQVSLGLDLAQALPDVAANPDQLEQVLVNVILNALDACSPGGHVLLRAREGDPRALALEVEDDGAGIPDELRNRIFDPFFTTKKRGKGTGLGLTVVEQLVRSHGGRIEVASAVGQGTRVRILWPLAASPGEERHG